MLRALFPCITLLLFCIGFAHDCEDDTHVETVLCRTLLPQEPSIMGPGSGWLSRKQGLQWMFADMKTRLEAAWLLTLQAAVRRATGEPFTNYALMAKRYASETVGFITDTALQIHGGYGFTREMPLERLVRDARILRIHEGSSEIQRTVVARMVLA
jgi:alkylation response protein AidB-like acyl-CoA dehydrogenase